MNSFDPKLEVRVVDITQGVPPDVLYYTSIGTDPKTVAVAPCFDFGDPEYVVPRHYAERLLENAGGRTFRLVSPSRLMLRMPNRQGGSHLVEFRAWRKRGENIWTEMSDQEIAAEEAKSEPVSTVGDFIPTPAMKTIPVQTARATKRAAKAVAVNEPEVTEDDEPSEPDLNEIL